MLFASTETDLESPGVMEGAIGAAQRVIEELEQAVAQGGGARMSK